MMTFIDIRILFIAFPDFFVVGKNPSRSEFDLAIKLDVTILSLRRLQDLFLGLTSFQKLKELPNLTLEMFQGDAYDDGHIPPKRRVSVAVTRPSKDTRLGLGISQENLSSPIYITYITPNSLFDGTELEVGMELETVNGTKYDSFAEVVVSLQLAEGYITIVASSQVEVKSHERVPNAPASISKKVDQAREREVSKVERKVKSNERVPTVPASIPKKDDQGKESKVSRYVY